MQSIEQFKAAQEKALQAHMAQLAIAETFAANGLPVPDYIGGRTRGAISVHYWNRGYNLRSLGQTIELLQSFPLIVPMAVMRAGCTTFHPEKDIPAKMVAQGYERDTGRHASDYAFELAVDHSGESGHTTAKVEFFARLNGELFSVGIDFGRDYIGTCGKLAPTRKETRDHRNKIASRTFEVNPVVYGCADSFLSFSYVGDSPNMATGADHRFLFVSDIDTEDISPADCSHAIAQLRNLADNLGV